VNIQRFRVIPETWHTVRHNASAMKSVVLVASQLTSASGFRSQRVSPVGVLTLLLFFTA
jgi:hypothetical protein